MVEQSFIKSNEDTNLDYVQSFLSNNGFLKVRNNDYYNESLGIILEDLHDENVLMRNGVMYFIDTAFFLTDKFTEGWNRQPDKGNNS